MDSLRRPSTGTGRLWSAATPPLHLSRTHSRVGIMPKVTTGSRCTYPIRAVHPCVKQPRPLWVRAHGERIAGETLNAQAECRPWQRCKYGSRQQHFPRCARRLCSAGRHGQCTPPCGHSTGKGSHRERRQPCDGVTHAAATALQRGIEGALPREPEVAVFQSAPAVDSYE